MNNICTVCKATIDEQWSSAQNEVIGMFRGLITNIRAMAFATRCIYCYKQYIEMKDKNEHNWYLEVMRVIEKQYGQRLGWY